MRRYGLCVAVIALVLAGAAAANARAAEGDRGGDLTSMDLEDLMDLEVTTVSKRATKVSESPAAVFVIGQEDIRRSGATTVPELLRMVPGVHVAQIDANTWAVSARGFDDEFANKLLVMIDGRSIYTPLFSGVLWHEQDLMLEDIDRIEVVRGPGGSVWGANAVNGVINIITKQASDTQGLLVSSLAGDHEHFTGAARWGGALGDDLHYRIYGKYAERDPYESTFLGLPGNDRWRNVRAGGRIDWDMTEADRFTFQGDFVDGEAKRMLPGVPFLDAGDEYTGGNVLARYSHVFSETSDLSLQAYYDRADRKSVINASEDRDVADVQLEHSFALLGFNEVTWGVGYRLNADHVMDSPAIFPLATFTNARQKDNLYSLFAQDEVSVLPDLLSFTLGTKLEYNDYTYFEYQPSLRVLLTPSDRHTFWASVSRAVHTPSRADEDITFTQVQGGTAIVAMGSEDYGSEKVLAYEVGYRARPIDPVTVDVAAFYNQYDDLQSANVVASLPGPPPTLILTFANDMKGQGYGAELSANWAVTDFLRLTGSYTFTRTDLSLKSNAQNSLSKSTLLQRENLTPRNRFRIGSRWNLPWNLEFDATLGWVDGLRNFRVDSYTRLDLRLGWTPIEHLELALVGLNVIEEHQEFPLVFVTQPSEVPRSFYGSVRWQF